ncbi:MAG: extracellular solute-binding protein, partial [Pseudomonadota bacterium]
MLVRTLAAAALIATTAAAQAEEIIVSHGYSNFGELKYGPDEAFAYVNQDAPKGGEISFATLATFDSFNPYTRKGVAERTGADLLYESIMTSAADDPYGIYCYLCTTIEYPESLDWMVVNLREDVTFADGTPMTAEDLKFSVDILLEQAILEFRNAYGGYLDSVEMTGPYQLRFEFNESAPKRDRAGMAGLWPAWSKAWFEENEARIDESAQVPFMGTGPYVLEDVDFGRTVSYVRDPDWWGADLPINRGRNNFDRVRVEAFLDQTAALEAFKVGDYTFRTPSSAREWAIEYDFPAVQRGHVVTESLPDGTIGAARGLAFNLRREPWQDARTREAVELMFNFEWSNRTLFYDLYSRPYSFWEGSDLAAEGAPTPGERAVLEPLVEEGLFDASILEDEAVVPPSNNAERNAVDRRTRRQAVRLLEEAGWVVGADGMARNEAGRTLELTIIQFDANLDSVMNPFIENLRSIGIDARLRRIDTAQYVQLRREGEWDLTNILPG